MLYDVEREAKQKHEAGDYEAFVAARHAMRADRSRPIFQQLHDWLEAEAPKVLPKSPIGEAIQYALNHWVALARPLEAGFLELDNGASERAFKPVALGRNYADLQIMRSPRQDRPVSSDGHDYSTPHNPLTGCRGTPGASPSLGSVPAGRQALHFGQHLLLHLQVGLNVLVGRLGTLVTQPKGDHSQVNAGLQEVHRRRVPDRMG